MRIRRCFTRLRAKGFLLEFPGATPSIGTHRAKFYLETVAARGLLLGDRRSSDQSFADHLVSALPFG